MALRCQKDRINRHRQPRPLFCPSHGLCLHPLWLKTGWVQCSAVPTCWYILSYLLYTMINSDVSGHSSIFYWCLLHPYLITFSLPKIPSRTSSDLTSCDINNAWYCHTVCDYIFCLYPDRYYWTLLSSYDSDIVAFTCFDNFFSIKIFYTWVCNHCSSALKSPVVVNNCFLMWSR